MSENILQDSAYGDGTKFAKTYKVTNPGGDYASYKSGEKDGNYSQKNSNISRLDMVNKQTANCGTAYNSEPIAETYKPATSNGVPNANAVEYETVKKDRNP